MPPMLLLLLMLLLLRDLFLPPDEGEGDTNDSSTSWMEAREDFLELWEEDLRERESWRGGMGVGTFSCLALAEAGVTGRDAFK